MTKRMAEVFSVCLLFGLTLAAGEKIDSDINWKIRREETERSQIMRLVHQLTDVYGPRVTGSPNFKTACDWAIEQMRQWGMQNDHLERWDFGHPGWSCNRYAVRVLSPYTDNLDARVVAWTPGTKGLVRAKVVQIDLPDRPTQESLAAHLKSFQDKVRGRIVLAGAHAVVPITFNPTVKRREDSELRTQYDPLNPVPPAPKHPPEQPADTPKPLEPREVDQNVDAFLLENGALMKVTDAARDHGQISVFANRTYDASKAVPSIVIRNEDYGRMSRILADGIQVEMEVEIVNTIHPDGQTSFNAIAEIPGTGNRDQVVMLGAHVDSWHAGTGATDNAAGAAVMMEAARILQKLGVQPARTIRLALWGGEEQGLLGSKAYVNDHFGTFEAPKPDFPNLVAYFNVDSGTGRVRGASVFGPPEAAAVLRQVLEPFQDLGVLGTSAVKTRSHGGTDSTSFNWAGLAGINFSQDPIEYFSHSWHTDLDTYERILEEDLKQCAIVVASAVYHLAMREEMLPRFTAETMPAPEKQ
jgi:carboxypeptidase Q